MSTFKTLLIVAALATLCIATTGSKRRRGTPHYVVNRWYDLPGYTETPYDECASGDGKVTKVDVIPCELDQDACILPSGQDSTINISFTSKVNSTTLKAVVHGVVGSIPIPFHIPQGNACENSGITCPIQAGTTYNYSTKIPVLKSYPKLSVKVKWELVDDKKNDVICVTIPAKIRAV